MNHDINESCRYPVDPADLAALGEGQVAYVKPMRSDDVRAALPAGPADRSRACSSSRCCRPAASRSC